METELMGHLSAVLHQLEINKYLFEFQERDFSKATQRVSFCSSYLITSSLSHLLPLLHLGCQDFLRPNLGNASLLIFHT